MKKQTSGFTLIELVIVITILAILAAIALPKYIAVQKDARVAKMQGLYGSIRTAAALAKARCELDLSGVIAGGACTSTGGTVNMDGTTVVMVNRYPQAVAAGIIAASSLSVTSDAVVISAGGAAAGDSITIDASGASTASNCRITYTAAAAVGFAPIYAIDVSDC